MKIDLDQLIGMKEAQRGLPKLLERIEADGRELILTRRSEPRAVLVGLDRYEQLLAFEESSLRSEANQESGVA